jgi:hypothetical protein
MPEVEKDRNRNLLSLATNIIEDLENRITSGELDTTDLSLKTLASYHNVRITSLRGRV